jgi:hypothetical protein
LFATTEIGMLAFLGVKSSKKQFVFCADSERDNTNIITMYNAAVLKFTFFICLLNFSYWLIIASFNRLLAKLAEA